MTNDDPSSSSAIGRFPLTSTEIDNAARNSARGECYEIAATFSRHAKDLESSGDSVKARGWHLLAELLAMQFHPRNGRQPFGAISRSGDRRSMMPEDLDGETAAQLQEVVPFISHSEVRARLADVVWLIRRRPELAQIAFDAYLACAAEIEDPTHWPPTIARLERALRLARSPGVKGLRFEEAAQRLDTIVRKYRGEDPLFLTAKAVELLAEFRFGDLKTYAEISEAVGVARTSDKNFHLARNHLLNAENIFRILNDEPNVARISQLITKTFRAEAELAEDNDNFLAAVFHWGKAIEAARRTKGAAEFVEKFQARMSEAARRAQSSFKKIEVKIDLADARRQGYEYLQGREKHDAIRRFALGFRPINFQTLRQQALQDAAESPLSHLVTRKKLDGAGRTVSQRPSMYSDNEEERNRAIFELVIERANQYRLVAVEGSLGAAFEQLLSEHFLTEFDIADLVTSSAFVPQRREPFYIHGFTSGFDGDFIAALHILIPQVENSIRHLMKLRGIVTTVVKAGGVQDEMDLVSLLVHERLSECLPTDLILELRTLLVEKGGPNLRNLLAHGMLEVASLRSVEAFYAWWLALKLCCGIRPTTSAPQAADAPAQERAE